MLFRSDPFQIYSFDGTSATLVADVPPEGFSFSWATIYNGGLVYSNGDNLYSYNVRPRAVRQPVSSTKRGALAFEVFDGQTALPATFAPTAGVADGEIRVSLLNASRETLPGPAPALTTLPAYYQLGASDGLADLRGELTLSYHEDAGVDEASLGVWRWNEDGQDWTSLSVTSRDESANTLTVSGVAPASWFVIGTNQPVASEEGVRRDGLHLAAPHPNPTASTAEITYTISEPGPVALAAYDALGREVARIASGAHSAGTHRARLDARALAPGVYVVRLLSGSGARAVRLTVQR